jgi:hypothetical protein
MSLKKFKKRNFSLFYKEGFIFLGLVFDKTEITICAALFGDKNDKIWRQNNLETSGAVNSHHFHMSSRPPHLPTSRLFRCWGSSRISTWAWNRHQANLLWWMAWGFPRMITVLRLTAWRLLPLPKATNSVCLCYQFIIPCHQSANLCLKSGNLCRMSGWTKKN